ncbi:histidine phosphatase family protein [Nocardiopsis sp. YSL2]|uniref:histidine phosphatase family protein n=1 Tax=Nocardiopsis sp. YSL2 TaxID=2939492 RepID=UPI0026F45C81|nr:histidine phosphatase family protein [Nocardiopsis sp. YSL2]
MRLVLVRHGRTSLNARHRFQAQTDEPLDPVGASQVRGIAEALSPDRWSAVYSSTMVRAVETADIIADRLGLSPARVHDLRERHLGVLDGTDRREFARRYPDVMRRLLTDFGFAPPEGETGGTACARVCRALDTIARNTGHDRGGSVLVVTHGGVLNLLSRALLGPHGQETGVLGNGRAACVDVDPTEDGGPTATLLRWDAAPRECEDPSDDRPVHPPTRLITKGSALA